MRAAPGVFHLSASDLSNHLACRHLTSLDFGVAVGARSAPTWHSPDLWVLQKRGLEHENAYVAHLAAQGLSVVDLRSTSEQEAGREVETAMKKGVDVIVQPSLATGAGLDAPTCSVVWSVRANSARGLMRFTIASSRSKPRRRRSSNYLCIQSVSLPFRVNGPSTCTSFHQAMDSLLNRTGSLMYAAYYRHVKNRLENAVENNGSATATYPEPTPHCSICRWWAECDGQRRKDDHLSLVAGISKLQQKQLHAWDVNAVGNLAVLPLPLERRPEHGSAGGYVRVREQARVQVAGRTQEKPVHEILDLNEEHGLFLLPEPSPGDMFFDLEGDPFIGRGGREYLFGFVTDDGTGNPAYASPVGGERGRGEAGI